MTQQDLKLSRRAMLAGGAGLVLALNLPMTGAAAAAGSAPALPQTNAYVRIGSDNSVTVISTWLEMGQGPLTGVATLLAEELDADWSQIRVENAPADFKLYGFQITGGSTAIKNSYEIVRRAGATARAMLVAAAARTWNVKPEEITVSKGMIRHAGTGKSGNFGTFAQQAAEMPMPAEVRLKDPARFALIGKPHGHRVDTLAKSTGQAKFGIDQNVPGMLTVVVARPEQFGATLASFDATEALKVRGVEAVKPLSSGVAVYARNMWAALKGRRALQIRWDAARAEQRDSAAIEAEYRRLAQQPGAVAIDKGSVATAMGSGATLIEAEYVLPYVAHAPMEPLSGLIEWKGDSVVARYGCQAQTFDQGAIAAVFGLTADKVVIETIMAGGSFGRRAQHDSHFARELAEAAKAIGPGKPVKLVWTREDDIMGGYYRPMALHKIRGAVRGGQVAAIDSTVVVQSFIKGTPMESMIVKNGIDPLTIEGIPDMPYDLPALRCQVHTPTSPIPTLWLRSVGHTHTGYVVETFIDRLLEACSKDPVEGRLALMGKAPRLAGALRAVAKLAGWPNAKPAPGRAFGVAAVESFDSYVAQIAEVSLDEQGNPRVHKVWCAVDCGVAVNPDVIRAQVEGGIGYGLGIALHSAVPIAGGKAAVSNFDSFHGLRLGEMPEVELVIVPSSEAPTGIGEPPVPPIAPAVANAMAKLGKERPLRLPLVPTA